MKAVEFLINRGIANPAGAPYSATLDLTEHQSGLYPLPAEHEGSLLFELARLFDDPTVRRLVAADLIVKPRDGAYLSLRTSSVVGFASVGARDDRLFVRVRPKVPMRRLMELAEIAERLPPWNSSAEIGEDDISQLVEWTVRSFVAALDKLITTGGVRRTHERLRDELRGRVRGKLLLPIFARNLAKGRADRLPCEFAALHIDNEANRLLRWAISLALSLTNELPRLADLRDRLKRAEHHLSEVALIKPTAAIIERGPILAPNLRHYAQCVTVARMLLRGTYLDAQAGPATAAAAALDMNELYEAAFWQLLKKREPTAVSKPSWTILLTEEPSGRHAKGLRLQPDVYVPHSADRIAVILDTKWKQAISRNADPLSFDSADRLLIRPRTSDVYQAATYALDLLRRSPCHSACIAALVYPCLGEVPDFKHQIRLGAHSIEIRIFGWDVLGSPATSIDDLWARIDQLRRTGARTALESAA